jgi:hypothetical protein
MNIKIIGVGKCGSRVCYDFFAFVQGLPTAYEIRISARGAGLTRVAGALAELVRFDKLHRRVRAHWMELTGREILKGAAEYVLVDSDLQNNELTGIVTVGAGDKQFAFPGYIYELDGFRGGCQYHIISENVTNRWSDSDIREQAPSLPNCRHFDIIAYAFSVGGGTGGGAAPQLARKVHSFNNEEFRNRQIHQLCIAVLPQTDRLIFENEPSPAMDVKEKYNSGRFFSGLYGGRHVEDGRSYLNSVWLLSNDLLRTISKGNAQVLGAPVNEDVLNNRALSLVNQYMASALATLCNASSAGTLSSGNIDAKELNGFLNGSPFISGFGFAKVAGVNGEQQDAAFLQMLFRSALCNTTLDKDSVQGLSVPIVAKSLQPLTERLKATYSSTKDLIDNLKQLSLDDLPIEFRTARQIVMIYGQTDANPSVARRNSAASMLANIFTNSECSWAEFRHSGDAEYLLILIVDPFVPAIVDAVIDYGSRVWLEKSEVKQTEVKLRDVVADEQFQKQVLEKAARKYELVDPTFLGDSTVQTVSQFEQPLPFEQKHFIASIASLHRIYHQKRHVAQSW